MKKNIKNSIRILSCLLIVSCSDYLDVQPKTKLLEDTVFSDEISIQSVLNGCYTNMAKESLYGGALTMSAVEVLGQRFNINGINDWIDFRTYQYKNAKAQSISAQIWADMYADILNINALIQELDKGKKFLSVKSKNIIKGEAFGLRAMCHFDLLRLFGPVYSENPSEKAIPYRTNPNTDLMERLPADKVMKLILSDLSKAEKLLEKDPIKTYGKVTVEEDNDEDLKNTDPAFGYKGPNFYRFRNFRMNYYAVKALQARVNLYAGNKPEALKAAKVVIEQASKWFPWINPAATKSIDPDRVFSSEVIFALKNKNLENTNDKLFGSFNPSAKILAPGKERLNETFENTRLNDYRYNSLWEIPSEGEEQEWKVFSKFKKVSDDTKPFKFMQPLIRISEMYYIAAETDPNPTTALKYLNTVRNNRGLDDLPATANLEKEITKEYQKEFYGEGQLFFYYKRKNFREIPNGSASSGNVRPVYVIPIPLAEQISE